MKQFFTACLLFVSFVLAGQRASAQTVVWSTDVAPILYNKCATCHRPSGIAPFSLLDYTSAATHAIPIRTQVQSGMMPPWPPDPAYNRLAHERLLSPQEKATIINWVNNSAPQGDPMLAPPLPVFSNNGDLPGTPDLVRQIPTYTSPAAASDVYRCFVLDPGIGTDKFITALEAIPGNRGIVHHVQIFADTTGISTTLDAQDPGPGYTSFGNIGTNNAMLLGIWVPGSAPMQFPAGFGVKLPHNAKIVVQVHYPAGSAGQADSTRVRFFFAGSPVRPLYISPVLNHEYNITPALHIPANTVKTFYEQITIPNGFNLTVMGMAPHMHLIGRSIKTYGVTPSLDTVKFIDIPHWHFHWQGFYMLRQAVKATPGVRLVAEAVYDNTVNNPMQPSHPPIDVHKGEGTLDEMMLVFVIFTEYQPGDENIVIDSSPLVPLSVAGAPYYRGVQLLEPYPNPASGTLYVKCHLDEAQTAGIELCGVDGKTVLQLAVGLRLQPGYSVQSYDISSLPPGAYVLRMTTAAGVQSRRILIAGR